MIAITRRRMVPVFCVGLLTLAWLCRVASGDGAGASIWIEGESARQPTVTRHPWYSQVKRDQLSGDEALMHFDPARQGVAAYSFDAPAAGEYFGWVRCNPVLSTLTLSLNGGEARPLDMEAAWQKLNIAADNKPDLRFIAWVPLGKVTLQKGVNRLVFRMEGKNSNHGLIDCIMFSQDELRPDGVQKPDALRLKQAERGEWVDFAPRNDPFDASALLDLRSLNEPVAGSRGFIRARGGDFVYPDNGEVVRFWAVNGPPRSADNPQALEQAARIIAKRGVNMIRWHTPIFDKKLAPDPAAITRAHDTVAAMKAQGIYTHFSIYFPLWSTPAADSPILEGYDGKTHPFAALMFNPRFQEAYLGWWRALLVEPDPRTGKALIDDPAVCSLEIQNEDSFFFWTFDARRIPPAQLRMIQKQFGDWLVARHGSLDAAVRAWGGDRLADDAPAEGRMALRPLWNLSRERNPRTRDTVAFLAEKQRDFYTRMRDEVRRMGYKGLITASNWHTASGMYFGPIERWTYSVGDFIDRHGYYECGLKGEHTWSIRPGYTYRDRNPLQGIDELARAYGNPMFAPAYAGMPQMISEVTVNRPNRYRTVFPLYSAAASAMQGNDAIVHFSLDGHHWSVKPAFWMQPWTLMSPTQLGQFPAAALIFRKGLVAEAPVVAEVNLSPTDLLAVKGTPLPIGAALDDLRQKDVPLHAEESLGAAQVIDPRVQFIGRTAVNFSERAGASKVADLRPHIDADARIITSAHRQVILDAKAGLLIVQASMAAGLTGDLRAAGRRTIGPITVEAPLEVGCVVAVSLDDRPLADSRRILLQVMSEEQTSGWATEPTADGQKKITSIGSDPWQFRGLAGVVSFNRLDAAALRVRRLDLNGYAAGEHGTADRIELARDVVYYLIEAR